MVPSNPVQAVVKAAISARTFEFMHYLIYVSQAARPMKQEELAEILRGSQARNDRDGITGLLIYRCSPSDGRGNFMQLLEGDERQVNAAYKRIAADRRHHTKIVLEEGDTPERNFPDWSMGFQNVEADELAGFEGYSDLGSPEFWTRAQSGGLTEPLTLMKSFYDSRD